MSSVTLFWMPHRKLRYGGLGNLYANSIDQMDWRTKILWHQPLGPRGRVRFGPRLQQSAGPHGNGTARPRRMHRDGHGADPRKEAPETRSAGSALLRRTCPGAADGMGETGPALPYSR